VVVQQVLGTLADLVPSWRQSMGIIDQSRGVFVVYEVHGEGSGHFDAGRSVPLSMFGGDLERLGRGEVDLRDDVSASPHAAGTLRDSPLRSQLLVPIRHHGTLLGTLNLGSTETAAFTEADAEVAAQLAEIVGHVLQRVRLRQELVRAHDDALRASADREAYIAHASHELRSPLNAVLGYLEMLDEEPDEITLCEVRPTLTSAQASARHMRALIDDLLALARAGADEVSLQTELVALPAFLDELVATSKPLMRPQRNRLVVRCPEDAMVHADPLRLHQALLNLLSNAARFTRDGTVSVEVTKHEHRVCIAVIDDGIGIEASKLPTLFDPFTQAHDPRDGYGGTGLGLAICDRYVRRMGGDIHVTSELGLGTTFTVRLPRS